MLEPKIKAAELRELYASNPAVDKAHMLIISKKGAGKTSLAKTCPSPCLILSFDPGGTIVLKAEIESGSIIVDTRFENDSPSHPTAAILLHQTLDWLEQPKVAEQFGTIIFDSTTTISSSYIWQILKKEGRETPPITEKTNQKVQGMQIQDWGTLLNFMQMITRRISNLACHTILLGHIGEDKDEVTGHYIKSIMIQGQSKNIIPILVPEFYVLDTYNSKDGPQRRLQTQGDSSFPCSTRMGGGKFDKFEPADIQALLKKAGMNFEDKEPI